LILAQDERWRRVLGMQVERTFALHCVKSFGPQARCENATSLLIVAHCVAMGGGEWQTGA